MLPGLSPCRLKVALLFRVKFSPDRAMLNAHSEGIHFSSWNRHTLFGQFGYCMVGWEIGFCSPTTNTKMGILKLSRLMLLSGIRVTLVVSVPPIVLSSNPCAPHRALTLRHLDLLDQSLSTSRPSA